MKKMKKILCLCLALAMCLSLVNLTALAADDTHTHDDNCPLCAEGHHEEGDVCDCCGYGDKDKNPDTEELSPQDDPKDCGVGQHQMTLRGNQLVCLVCNTTCDQVDENGRHKTESATKEATCFESGYATVSCITCGTVTETIPALSADYSGQKWEPYGDGQHKMTCKNCDGTPDGHSKTESCADTDNDGKCDDCGVELKKDCDHRAGNHKDNDQYKAPTCTEKGQQVYICNECGGVVDNKEIDPLGHEWGEWKVNKPATETSEGEEERFCDRCGAHETRPIPALHKHTLKYCAGTPATCTLSGMEESWYCTECDEHFRDESGTQPATKEDLTIPALEPVFNGAKWAPQDGLKHIRYCVNCGGEGELHEEISAHNFNDWYTSKEATCTEDGLKVRECKDCGYKEEQVIPALGHDLKWCEGEEQSCFEAGRRGYWYCERCNKGFLGDDGTGEFTDKDLLAIPGLDADYNGQQWEPYTDTQHKMVCKNCNGVADKHTEYAPHNWGEWYAVEDSATLHVRECEDCGAKQEATHRMGDWVIDQEATVEEEGSQHRDCADCEYTEYETIAKLIDENGGGNNGGNNSGGDNNNGGDNNGGNNNNGDDDTDIPDENPPLVDLPDEETPTVETPTEETPVPVVDLPDEEPPLTDLPDEEPPLVELPDEEPPLVDLPDEQPPLTDIPMEQPILAEQVEVDISDDPTPLANVPQTGDYSLMWLAALVLSVSGLAVLTLKKREDEEN